MHRNFEKGHKTLDFVCFGLSNAIDTTVNRKLTENAPNSMQTTRHIQSESCASPVLLL